MFGLKLNLMKRAIDDNNDECDEEEASFESLSEETIPHSSLKLPSSPTKMKPAGAPLSDVTFTAIRPLQRRRKREGILPDDGSDRREDKAGDIHALYGRAWLQEAVARQRLLNASVIYQFARKVSGGSNLTIETFLKESEISRVTRERIAQATQALIKRRQDQQDTRGEQERAKDLHKQVEELRTENDKIVTDQSAIVAAQQCINSALFHVNEKRLSFATPVRFIVVDDPRYATLFDSVTRSIVARFGPNQFDKSLILFKTVVQGLHGRLLAANRGDADYRERINADMPRSSELALYWSVLMAIYLKADLLERVAQNSKDKFPANSEYAKNPEQYAADLRSLGTLLFTRPASPPTDNLLTLDEITIFFWMMLNTMIKRSSDNPASAPELGRPLRTDLGQGGVGAAGARRREIIVNDIPVTIDIPDEDLRAAVLGQDVFGVDRDKLATFRSKLYKNVDQARTAELINKILDPMLRAVWPFVFYTKYPLNTGLDEEAFAGGYYGEGRTVALFEVLDDPTPALTSFIGLAAFATYVFDFALKGKFQNNNWVFLDQNRFNGIFTEIRADVNLNAALQQVFGAVFTTSKDTIEDYEKKVLSRYLRKERFLACFAAVAVLRRARGITMGITDTDFAALRAYDTAIKAGSGPPGSTDDKTFATLEDAAYRAFLSSTSGNAFAGEAKRARYLNINLKLSIPQWSAIHDAVDQTTDENYATTKVATNTERINLLGGQEEAIQNRINLWLGRSVNDDVALLKSIIEEGAGGNPENALSPINTGYLFFTEVYTNALQDAYTLIEDHIPCVARVYNNDELIESELYQTRYASLVSSVLRLVDARNPKTYRPDRTEQRARLQAISPIDSLRGIARQDRAVRHWPGCGCGVVGAGGSGGNTLDFAYSAPYPLAPSLQVARGAF